MTGSGTTFNGVLGSGTFDHGKAAFYRAQDEARRLADRITRAELWIIKQLAGQQFATEDDMRAAVTEIVIARGNLVDDELARVIRSCVTSLWGSGRYSAVTPAAA